MSKYLKITFGFVGILAIAAAILLYQQAQAQAALKDIEALGQFLYFDGNLSEPDGQSCASCHDPAFGFDDPDDGLPVSEGVILGLFGGRNSPASSYAMYSPIRYFDEEEGLWIGGQFWDSRATGEYLGDPLADQAVGPFLNPVEMANSEEWQVVRDVGTSTYSQLFMDVWEMDLSQWGTMTDDEILLAYNRIGLSIAAFERTQLFGQFSSQYDAYLAKCLQLGGTKEDCAVGIGKAASKAGKLFFTKEQWYGFQLFVGENDNDGILEKGEGAMCAACHVTGWTEASSYSLPVQSPAWAPAGWVPPVFSDFTYDNLGVPKSEDPLLVNNPVDLGLGPVVVDPAENGKFKVMSLRNIGLTGPYAHNGYFDTLKEITHFYNTRDVPGSLPKGMDWPTPEYAATVNFDELGNLGLSDADEDALVEFMKTLSDGFAP